MANSNNSKGSPDRRRRQNTDGTADWAGADAGLLSGVIAAVTKDGGAVRFGYSRDGGAYALGIYGDGEPFTEYLGATEDVDHWLTGVRLDYE